MDCKPSSIIPMTLWLASLGDVIGVAAAIVPIGSGMLAERSGRSLVGAAVILERLLRSGISAVFGADVIADPADTGGAGSEGVGIAGA